MSQETRWLLSAYFIGLPLAFALFLSMGGKSWDDIKAALILAAFWPFMIMVAFS